MENIREFERMAKLALPENEQQNLSLRAGMLINSFRALEETDTAGLKPLISVLQLQNVLRQDVRVKAFTREEMLKNAPESFEGYFQAPRTLD